MKTSCLFLMIALVLAGAGSSAFGQQANGASEAAKPSSPAVETKPPVVLSNRSVSTLNVDYVGKGDPLQSLDIYAPKGVTGASVYVFVHGGGWNKRDKDEVGSQPKLLNDAGIVAVSLNYRLVPAIQHPENVRDVAAAIAWLTKNIAKFGGDPKKMVLMGHSAGSHLVALVATDDRYLAAHGLHRNALAGVICLDGSAFDIPDRIKNGAPTVAENCRRAFGDNPTMQVDGSPVTHVKGKVPLPPFFLVFLNEDSLNHKQSARFAELVRAEGGRASLEHITDGKTHQSLCDDLGTESDHTGPLLIKFVSAVTK